MKITNIAMLVGLCATAAGCTVDDLPYHGAASQGASYAAGGTGVNAGTVVLHALNKAEYNATVRDLLNTLQTPADNLPPDATAFGFDNIAASLTITDASARIYQAAAESLAAEAANPNGAEYARLVTCQPVESNKNDPCLDEVAANFAYYAWRRPVTADDVNDIVQAARANATDFPSAVANVVSYALLAPDFLYRIELDPNANVNVQHVLNDYELASRLSYFLWSSMPDDALFAAADNGTLHEDSVLTAQVERMLADPKAIGFVQNFAGQWLELRALAAASPSPTVYPAWSESLRSAMLAESQRFFKDFITSDVPLSQMLTAQYTYVNGQLAQFYGIPAPTTTDASGFGKVTLPDSSLRAGILGQGAWLTTQSHSDRSGIVSRGKFVLGQLLCDAPGAPPPGVPALGSAAGFAGTQRQHLTEHATNATCAACHNTIDPIGFAFESFDGIGTQRTLDNNFPVDTTGTFDNKAFSGARDLVAGVASDTRFNTCAVSTLFTYALGRSPNPSDQATLSGMNTTWTAQGGSLPKLIELIVLSDAFRTRGGTNN